MIRELLVEIPLSDKKCKARGFPLSVGCLVVSSELRGGWARLLTSLYEAMWPDDKSLYFLPINEFSRPNKLIEGIKGKVSLENGGVGLPRNSLSADLIESWEAESIVAFFASTIEAEEIFRLAKDSGDEWFKFSGYGSEQHFLRSLGVANLFFFYDSGNKSIEVIGEPIEVLRCLKIYLELE